MMTVLGCITDDHAPWLVFAAMVVCITGSWSTVRLFGRAAAATGSSRAGWHVLAAVAAGAAVWCTHFIAMLGYDPGVPVAYDPALAVFSLLVATAGAAAGLVVAAGAWGRFAPALGGGILGLAIAAMHYTGMMAYRVQGVVSWDLPYLAASILLAVVFSAAALHLATRRIRRVGRAAASGALALAIVGLHFTGMTAFRVEPMLVDGSFSDPAALQALAFAIAGVAVVVFVPGFATRLIDDHSRAESAQALRNMSNGLVMVSGRGTIRLYNDRVLSLFGLAPDELRVGMPMSRFLRNIGARVGWDEARTQRVIDNHGQWMARDATTRVSTISRTAASSASPAAPPEAAAPSSPMTT